ncbi:MAG: oxidative damage protection protein [Bdellovibrionota bacterium]|jgi:Fe-S cluster biosynthesis and repair protein YggX
MASEEKMVHCVKYGKEMAGLEKAPFPGKLGEAIYKKVSKAAWDEWQEEFQIRILNEYRLNMGELRDYDRLLDQMCLFLNLEPPKKGADVEVEKCSCVGKK